MSRTRYRIFENEREYPYFMTCTVVGWLAIFTRPAAVQIVLDSWKRRSAGSNRPVVGCPVRPVGAGPMELI